MTTVLRARSNLPLKVVAAIWTETWVPLDCFIISFWQPLQNGLLICNFNNDLLHRAAE